MKDNAQTTGIVVGNTAKVSLDAGKMVVKDIAGTALPLVDTFGMGVVDIAVETARGFGVGCLKAGARATINAGIVKDVYSKNLAEFRAAKEEREQILNEARQLVQQRQLEKQLENTKKDEGQGALVTA